MNAQYTAVAKTLHWLIALLIVGIWTVGQIMTGMDKADPSRLQVYGWHKSFGFTVLCLVVLRIIWRKTHPAPALPEHMPAWEKYAADLSHGLLYWCMLIMPLSGWAMSSAAGYPVVVFGSFTLPMLVEKSQEMLHFYKQIHYYTSWALAGLVVLHASAALKHYFIDRDDVLQRMLPRLRRTKP